MAGGHLSSWNDGNGLGGVKQCDVDVAVTSLLLKLFSTDEDRNHLGQYEMAG